MGTHRRNLVVAEYQYKVSRLTVNVALEIHTKQTNEEGGGQLWIVFKAIACSDDESFIDLEIKTSVQHFISMSQGKINQKVTVFFSQFIAKIRTVFGWSNVIFLASSSVSFEEQDFVKAWPKR
jgi:hypothetical protein